jgi:hypothetical protein
MEDDTGQMEQILIRYRPVGPPADLRDRVTMAGQPRPQRSRLAIISWLAAAATLALTVGLNMATNRLLRETAKSLGPEIVWTEEAEEMAKLLDGQGQGRQYIAFCLAASRQSDAFAGMPQPRVVWEQ